MDDNQSKIEEIASKVLGKTSDGQTMMRYETPDQVDKSLLVGIPRNLNRTHYNIAEQPEEFIGIDINRVTINKNNRLGKHKHPNQKPVSYGYIFGDFIDGELVVESETIALRNKWFQFGFKPGQVVTPIKGLNSQETRQWKYQKYIKDYLRCIAGVDRASTQKMGFSN